MELRALCRLGLLAVATTCLASCGFPDYGIDYSSGQADGEADVATTDGSDATPPEGGGGDADDADVSPPDADAAELDAAGLDAADEADATDAEGDVIEASAECLSGADCTDPTKPLCELSTGRCGACLPSTDDCPYGEYCDAASLTCEAGCKDATDCVPPEPDAGTPDDGGGPGVSDGGALQCDLATHQCVGCQQDDDCVAGTICQGNSCVPGCTAQHACQAGHECCSGSCVFTETDPSNCGSCGNACAALDHATAACSGGVCGIGVCDSGWADCDDAAADGCEINIATSMASCGGCGHACAPAHATGACAVGVCTIASCSAGFADCDLIADNGCETDLNNSPSDCGGCGRTCSGSNVAAVSCSGGLCDSTCNTSYGNCSTPAAPSADDGCETNLGTSISSCGACGRACSGSNVAAASCSGGLCNSTCNTNYGNCSAPAAPSADDGCETNVGTSTSNCGGCGRVCDALNVASLACSDGLCTSTCTSGYGNCTRPSAPSPDNGCETAVSGDTNNCGACGRVCSASNVTTLACSGGLCTSTCTSGRGNCSQPSAPALDDGCETSVMADVNHCGACNRACSPANAQTLSCTAGVCNSSCLAGYGNCGTPAAPTADDGCETNINTSTANCGSCGRDCSTANVATAACSGGLCTSSCNAGYGNCTMPPSPTVDNGCELNLNTQCAGSACCGTLCTALHDNGLGQTYSDCHALGVPGDQSTYTATMANEAAAAWPGGGTVAPATCGKVNDKSDCVYQQGASSCAVWCYTNGATSPRAGWVYLNTASSTCYCPTPDASDKPWY